MIQVMVNGQFLFWLVGGMRLLEHKTHIGFKENC